MRSCFCVALLVFFLPLFLARAEDKPKKADFTVLSHEDLKQFEGVWEMKVETKKGWKGTIRATITRYPAGSKQENFGNILYEYDLVRGKEQMSIENAPIGGIGFAGVKQGKNLMLVTCKRQGIGPTMPFTVDPKEGMSAPAKVDDGKLHLDVSKSVKPFCFPLSRIDLEWGRLEFTKVKKDK